MHRSELRQWLVTGFAVATLLVSMGMTKKQVDTNTQQITVLTQQNALLNQSLNNHMIEAAEQSGAVRAELTAIHVTLNEVKLDVKEVLHAR